jgi:hypothetical protein
VTQRSRRQVGLLRALCVCLGLALLAVALAAAAEPAPELHAVRNAQASPAAAAAPVPIQWCGGDRSGADRAPDLMGGNSVHVIYAIPSDGADGFSTFVHRIATDIGAIDAWWRRQDPARTPRFDVAPFAGCTTNAGQLDISFVRLPRPSTGYLTLGSNLGALAQDLSAGGFATPSKRYLVYYDGPTNETDVCGTAFRDPTGTGSGAQFFAAIWMRACDADVGAGNVMAAAAAHELLHALGALPRGAPHVCPDDDGHPCDSPLDLMYPELSANFETLVLDAGRDDYYAHSGGWLDLQDSRWLMRADLPPSLLTVALQPRSPQDRVTSEPVGVGCPAACALFFDTGSQVRLTATPGPGSRLVGWTGACTGAAATCAVTMDAAKTVQAVFGPNAFRLSLVVTGQGRMTAPAAALACSRRCSTTVAANALVRVRAAAARGWRFVSWTGACRGRGACSVRLSENRSVGAIFRRVPPRRG